MAASVAYYVEKLGFQCRFKTPENDPFFAIVGRDSVSILLKHTDESSAPQPNCQHHAWARWDAFVNVDAPDELFADFEERGAKYLSRPAIDDDGLHGFEIEDEDGYVLYFGRPT